MVRTPPKQTIDLQVDLTFHAFRILPFRNREIGVALHSSRGLVVFDPFGQRNISTSGQVRLYIAGDHRLAVLHEHLVSSSLAKPVSDKQAWLAARGYASFLNPKLERPSQLSSEKHDADLHLPVDSETYIDAHQEAWIDAERRDDLASWGRSNTDGWFYDDDD